MRPIPPAGRKEEVMLEAPKRIMAWPDFEGEMTGGWSANQFHDERAEAYILAA